MIEKKILCTIGPTSLNEITIKVLEKLGATLLRINLSHTNIEDLESVIKKIRKYTKIPICIDTEGAQIRTNKFNFNFKKDQIYKLKNNKDEFSIRPFHIIEEQVKEGDLISIDFNNVVVKVTEVLKNLIKVKTINPGKAGENKAVSILKEIDIPPFSQKDYEALKISSNLGITNYAISFASSRNNIKEIRKLVPKNSFIISKVESRKGLHNLLEIIDESDAILIDRGDLSREISLEKIPLFQKVIIKKATSMNKEVYVATNLLESMIENPTPTRAEVNDIFNTLLDGASGLVLAAETAIGKYPIDSVEITKQIVDFYNSIENIESQDFNNYEIIKKNI